MWIKVGTGWKKKGLMWAFKREVQISPRKQMTTRTVSDGLTNVVELLLLLWCCFLCLYLAALLERDRKWCRETGDRCSSHLPHMSVHLVPSASPPISELRIIISTAELWFMLLCCRLRVRSQEKKNLPPEIAELFYLTLIIIGVTLAECQTLQSRQIRLHDLRSGKDELLKICASDVKISSSGLIIY